MSKKIYKYVLGMHHSSDIEGIFIMSDEQLKSIKEMKGREVYYGEIAGKHSEVRCELNYKDVEIVSSDEKEIQFFERLFPNGVGFNFLNYWFDETPAYDCGYESGRHESYATVKEALKANKEFDNSVLRKAFKEGFKSGQEDKNGR